MVARVALIKATDEAVFLLKPSNHSLLEWNSNHSMVHSALCDLAPGHLSDSISGSLTPSLDCANVESFLQGIHLAVCSFIHISA
jgi:hypothetical protein